ncbi:tRNA pseudouridine(38,39,40) synthase [Raphidocelis subcapitata]|uniref:tRNA pseudouridine synthase n=1 Tax=Raphidocelis subcapitata TaxID=307507 RepID=A0A2V0NU19_9CHLO|nr:tRNA pseudouridine(38,39,40) synthase [Raphidocelis subcapitata]|eukprot:GBF90172.1 tRNA pseudouridine(38,39,40) synthase [Raphidocelis subcapitata]
MLRPGSAGGPLQHGARCRSGRPPPPPLRPPAAAPPRRPRAAARRPGPGPAAALPAQPVRQQESHRLKLTVAYDGTKFAGFQWQAGNVRTVQGELEKAAARVMMPASRAVGASRTDGGAHAVGQVAHLDAAGSVGSFDFEALALALNGALPEDLKVRTIELAPPGFDSHFSSLGKEYAYLLECGCPSPHEAKLRWWVYDRHSERSRGRPQRDAQLRLDVAAMREAAELLKGVHDYSTFADKKRPSGLGRLKRKKPHLAERGIKPERTSEKNFRHVWKLEVLEEPRPAWPPGDLGAVAEGGGGGGGEGAAEGLGSGRVRVEVAGNGFLYRMVRVIVALLVEVGHGRMTPAAARAALEAGDRGVLPFEAAPPHGLYLLKVFYELPPGIEAVPRSRPPRPAGDGDGDGDGGDGGDGGGEAEEGEEA